jgi:hypothetical protein
MEMQTFSNIFACLVHESFECIIDLLQNLNYFDPSSLILLYNGGPNKNLLDPEFPFGRYNTLVIPDSKALQWGRLHDFAFDAFRFAIQNFTFDTLTIVDSDQLCIRRHYSRFVSNFLRGKPKIGLLGSSKSRLGPDTSLFPVRTAHAEFDLWKPLLECFEGGLQKFAHWSFWPTTVFAYRAVRDICEVLGDGQLQDIIKQTCIFATEEIVLPTLVALLGYEIEENPCGYQFVRYKVSYTLGQLDDALRTPNAYWLHPIPRQYNAPLRQALRGKCNDYEPLPNLPEAVVASAGRPLLLTLPILSKTRQIEGWLDDEEADLLISTTAKALEMTSQGGGASILEVGSYCGKGTVLLGLTIKGLGHRTARVYTIDPHNGRVGAHDQGIIQMPPTFEKFSRNIREAGVADLITPLRAHSYELAWDKPIVLLFIDGLHDYPNVARDFYHFAKWVQPGGFAVFHDYADYFPGVMKFVDALVNFGEYQFSWRVKSLVVLEKK